MSDTTLIDVLNRQFAKVHSMLRDAAESCPPDQWRTAEPTFFAPARLAFHLVQATDFHLDPDPKAFDWNRFGFDWEEAPPQILPDAAQLTAYLDEVEAKVNARLASLGPEGLLGPDYAGFFPTALDHVLYTLRHAQHHTGQINAELKRRGLKVAGWR